MKNCKICGNVIGKTNRKLLQKWGFCRKHLPTPLSCQILTQRGIKCGNPKESVSDRCCKLHKRYVPPGETQRLDRSEYKIKYEQYLLSDQWKHKSLLCKERFNYRCAICNSKTGLHVHHRTYENVFDEKIEDLTLLCMDCHKLFHQNTLNYKFKIKEKGFWE